MEHGVRQSACPHRMQPSLVMIQGKDHHTHFSSPPRRWGGSEWSATKSVSRGGKSSCPKPTQPSLALIESEEDQTHLSGPP